MAGRWWSRMIAGLAALAVVLFAAAPLPAAAAAPQPMATPCTEHQAPAPKKQPAGMPCCLGELCAMTTSVLPPRPAGLFVRQPAIVAFRPAAVASLDGMPVPPLYRPPRATL